MSVQVNYTVPGWLPGPIESRPGVRSAFQIQLDSIATPILERVDELLGLNRPQPGDLKLAPPPRPAGLAYLDAEEDRRRWHKMMHKHANTPQPDPRVGQMLALLDHLQNLEDQAIAAVLSSEGR